MKNRPIGLTIFAVLNFIFVGMLLLSFLVIVSTLSLHEQVDLDLSAYTMLSTLVTAGLLMVSGIGFFGLSYRTGFICGIAFCVLSIGNIIVFSALRGIEGFNLQLPLLIYAIVLLLMLLLRYRPVFLTDKSATEQKTGGNAVIPRPILGAALNITKKEKGISGGFQTTEEERVKRRPAGLTIFAALNFTFVGLGLLIFLVIGSSSSFREPAGVNMSVYTMLSPIATAVMLIVSGIGFLKLSYRMGFLCGVAFSVLSLGNIIVVNAFCGFEGFGQQVPSMIYPIVLLLMLTLKYRPVFLKDKSVTEQGTDGSEEIRASNFGVPLGVTKEYKIINGGSLVEEAISAGGDLKTRKIARTIIGFNLFVGPILFIVGGLGFLVGNITLGYPIAAILIFVGAYLARNYLSPTGTMIKEVAIAINSVALIIAGAHLISNLYKLIVYEKHSRGYVDLFDYWFFGVWLPLIPVTIVLCTLFFMFYIREFNTLEPDSVNVETKFENDSILEGHKCYCEKCGKKVAVNYGDAYTTLCKKCT